MLEQLSRLFEPDAAGFQSPSNCRLLMGGVHPTSYLMQARLMAGMGGHATVRFWVRTAESKRRRPSEQVSQPFGYDTARLSGQDRSPTISSLLTHNALACSGSRAYERTPEDIAGSSTTSATWQSSQYRAPTSPAGATNPAHTDVAAPCATVFHVKAEAAEGWASISFRVVSVSTAPG